MDARDRKDGKKVASPKDEKKRDHRGNSDRKDVSLKDDKKHDRRDHKGDGDKKDLKDEKRDNERKEEKSKERDRKEDKTIGDEIKEFRKESDTRDDRRSPARRPISERRRESRDSPIRRDNRSPIRRDRDYERKRNYSGEDRGYKRYNSDYIPPRPAYTRRFSSDFPPKRDYRDMPRFPPAGAQTWEDKVQSFLCATKPTSSHPDMFNTSAPPPYPPPFAGTGVVTLPDLSQPPPNMIPGLAGAPVPLAGIPVSLAGPPVPPPCNVVHPTMSLPPVVPGLVPLEATGPNPYVEPLVAVPYTGVPVAEYNHNPPQQQEPALMPVEAAPRSYSPVEPHVKGEFKPYDPNEGVATGSEGRSSETRERPVLTAKQKKKIEKSRNPLWQFVAKMLLNDENFQQMRKKKKKLSPLEEREDIHRRGDEAAIRISLKLEKAGFDDPKLWTIVKDKGPQGLCEDLRVAVLSCIIETNPDSSKKKDVMDATLLSD